MSQPLTSVSDNEEMWVYFSMSEKELQGLMRKYGSRTKTLESFPVVSLSLSDGNVYQHTGKIETLSGIVNPQTGAVRMKAVFHNPERLLLSGSTGNIMMPHTERNAIVIPRNATYEIQDKIYVYRVVGGKAESVEIEVLHIDDGNSYIVTSGLNAGDKIVTEGVGTLHDGQEIKTRNAAE